MERTPDATYAGVGPAWRMLGSPSRPKTANEIAPAITVTKCPIMVSRGLDLLNIGDSKTRYAVGPRDGKISGCLNSHAAKPLTPNTGPLAVKE